MRRSIVALGLFAVLVSLSACRGCLTPQADWCFDGVVDIDETGLDCGGPTCEARCATGEGCVEGSDCLSFTCNAGICAEPACDDTFKDGAETDVDCGGPVCPKCGLGKACLSHSDCAPELSCSPATHTCSSEPAAPGKQITGIAAGAGQLTSGGYRIRGGVGQVGGIAGPVLHSGSFSIAGGVAGSQP